MGKVGTFLHLLKTPSKMIKPLGQMGFFNWMDDKTYLQMLYKAQTGKKLNLENPQTFNEKLQWIKLYDRKEEYTAYVDKYEVRKYIEKTIGKEYLIPMIAVYDTAYEISWQDLPDKFVLKCTHGSHTNIICKDKSKLNVSDTKKKLRRWMKQNWYDFGREWPYKNVKPRIICEQFMTDHFDTELKDYKFFCFNGQPKALFIATGRGNDMMLDFYDIDFNHLPITRGGHPNANLPNKKPKSFDKMVELAKKLSVGIPEVRVDFYDINNKVYFGEMTFFSGSGFSQFDPDEWDYTFGKWITLPPKSNQAGED